MNPETGVVLATMPYAHVMRPSIALRILKTALLKNGVCCSVEYVNVRFVKQIGIDLNSLMMHLRTDSLIGEWTFVGAAFREEREPLAHCWAMPDRISSPTFRAARSMSVDSQKLFGVYEILRPNSSAKRRNGYSREVHASLVAVPRSSNTGG